MNKLLAIGIGALLLLLLILFSTTYQVRFHEVAIKTRFGKTTEDAVVTTPGLHFRAPIFIDRVKTFDKRLQLLESPMEWIQTADQQQVILQTFLMWRVGTTDAGALDFMGSFGTIDRATDLLTDQLRDAMAVFGRYNFSDLVGEGNKLARAEADVLAELQKTVGTRGVEPVSVGVSQILLPPKTTSAVLTRMEATRSKLAEQERFKGNAEANRIRSEASTIADKIRAFANGRAEEIRLAGEEAAAKYLEQMSEDEDLAIFLVWLDALESALSDQTTLVIPTGFEPFHLLSLRTANEGGSVIPMPANGLDAQLTQESADDSTLAGRGQ